MVVSTEERLAKRKLDALKRGIHRVGKDQASPLSLNIVGVGKAGADVVERLLTEIPETAGSFSAIIVDIGDGDLAGVREAANTRSDRAVVEIIALAAIPVADLMTAMAEYGTFLELEYPWYRGPREVINWLPLDDALHDQAVDGLGASRAYAKALYGVSYYAGDREMRAALRRFGERVTASDTQPVVCMVFGMGGGTGGGIAVDLARHLSTVILGRAALTVGVGILPCAGDRTGHRGGPLYACLNELDCFGDEAKNEGVVQSCGELFRNPFTAGFLVVPQQHVWEATKDIEATHARVSREIADLLSVDGGRNLLELLRLLNWVAAPSTQHSAARTPFGAKWIHMLAFADYEGPLSIGNKTLAELGLRSTYHPEYIELRVSEEGSAADAVATKLASVFSPDVPPQIIAGGGSATSVQYVLPCLGKFDLEIFYDARAAYDASSPSQRVLDHAMLLELGVVLSEPSTRLVGMAGAGLHGGDGWVAVPLEGLRVTEGPSRNAKLMAI